MNILAFIRQARAYRDRHGLSNAALARRAGLHVNTLRQLDSDTWSPRADTIDALSRVIEQQETA